LGLKVEGIYCVPCECGKVYVGQTGRTIEIRCKEHMRYIRLYQPQKSVVAENIFETGHNIDFSNTSILDKATTYMDRAIKEAIEIMPHSRNLNTDRGWPAGIVEPFTKKHKIIRFREIATKREKNEVNCGINIK
jgi:hypothetical protein